MIATEFDGLDSKNWFEFWCTTHDYDNHHTDAPIAYYIKSTNSIWDGECFIPDVPVELANYITTHYRCMYYKRKNAFEIGVAYEVTRIIEIEFSRKAIIDKFLRDME